jgi:hypothetical protein
MNKLILIAALILVSVCTNGQLSNGLIAKYYFNKGNSNDDGGKYHGQVNGATLTSDRFGNANKAYQFAINQTITVKDTNPLDGMINGLSISFWVSAAPIISGSYSNNLISKFSHCGGGADAYNICIYSNNTILAQLDDQFGLDVNQFSSKTVADNKWHHVVLVWNKPNVIMYIDNAADTLGTYLPFNSTLSNSNEVLAFGQPVTNFCQPPTYVFDHNEKLDDIRIYNRALDKHEIDSLFKEVNPVTSSIINSENNSYLIYPNPVNDKIEFPCLSNVKIYDGIGKLVLSINNAKEIDVSQLKQGIYILNITNDKGDLIQNSKIVIKRE